MNHKFDIDQKLPNNLNFKNYYSSDMLFYKPKNKYDLVYDYNDLDYQQTVISHLYKEIALCHDNVGFLDKPDIH